VVIHGVAFSFSLLGGSGPRSNVRAVKIVGVVIGAILAAALLVVASVAVTLYVTSDSRSGIARTTVDHPWETDDEAHFICHHSNAEVVVVRLRGSDDPRRSGSGAEV
jgi:hypothetical protein